MSCVPQGRGGGFEGPLDLLLEEVRRQRVRPEDLAMAPLVARFLSYVSTATERNLVLDMEWLHVAATLIEWKSRLLLRPQADSTVKDAIREEIIRQLLAYRKISTELGKRRGQENAHYARPTTDPPSTTAPDSREEPFVSVWDLIQHARELARWVEKCRREKRDRELSVYVVDADEAGIKEMSTWLRERLAASGPADLIGLMEEEASIARRNALILGALEMARCRQIQLQQIETFGPIRTELTGIAPE